MKEKVTKYVPVLPVVPCPVKVRVTELPGPALTAHRYNGFGKELFVPVSEGSEQFEESAEPTEPIEKEGGE